MGEQLTQLGIIETWLELLVKFLCSRDCCFLNVT
jgi:hypothetical protein